MTILLLFCAGFAVVYWLWRVRARRRERVLLLARPFPPDWRDILRQNVPLFSMIPAAQRQKLEARVQRFLVDMPFEGCGGLEIDDEIRVTIAGQACLLVLGRDEPSFPRLRSILVYPSAYSSHDQTITEGGFVAEGEQSRLGESWDNGYVVLAWDAVLHGAADMDDGHNVVLHEFAHQLDQEDGPADGVPSLDSPLRYGQWARVLERDFTKLVKRSSRGRKSVLDSYGATNPAEFFAVATETFFEKPRALRHRYPELYDLLTEFYGLEPSDWAEGE